jgi:hypothetical protein
LKSGSLNLLEPSGPVQACNGIALPSLSYISSIMSITLQEQEFLTWINWVTGSRCVTHMDCRKKFCGCNVPDKSAINHCAWKLKRTNSLLDEHGRRCWLMYEAMKLDMWARLQCSPRWRLCWFLHESSYSYSTSQRTANKAKLPPFRVTVIYQMIMLSKFPSKFQGKYSV